jgi:hypothetical protein
MKFTPQGSLYRPNDFALDTYHSKILEVTPLVFSRLKSAQDNTPILTFFPLHNSLNPKRQIPSLSTNSQI